MEKAEKERTAARRKAMLEKRDGERCETCRFFKMHYVYEGESERFVSIREGHCMNPRLKKRRGYDLCDRYEEKSEKIRTERETNNLIRLHTICYTMGILTADLRRIIKEESAANQKKDDNDEKQHSGLLEE